MNVRLCCTAVLAMTTFVTDGYACGRPYPTIHTTPIVTVSPLRPVIPAFAAGTTVKAVGQFLGGQPGSVICQLGPAILPCPVLSWNSEEVRFALPSLALQNPAIAQIQIVLPTGRIVRGFDVRLMPPAVAIVADLPVAPVAPVPPVAPVAPVAPELNPASVAPATPADSAAQLAITPVVDPSPSDTPEPPLAPASDDSDFGALAN